MDLIITITAFSVAVPFVVGMLLWRRLPAAMMPVVLICGVWLCSECYSYTLRMNGMENAFMSYLLTPVEVFLFTSFIFRLLPYSPRKDLVGWLIFVAAVTIVTVEYIYIRGSINTISLAAELVYMALLSIYSFFHSKDRSTDLVLLSFIFFTLTSFPYFFAYEWLRVSDVVHLRFLSVVYAYTHAACYMAIAFAIWKSTLSWQAR